MAGHLFRNGAASVGETGAVRINDWRVLQME
jgi:hypothetical protein